MVSSMVLIHVLLLHRAYDFFTFLPSSDHSKAESGTQGTALLI